MTLEYQWYKGEVSARKIVCKHILRLAKKKTMPKEAGMFLYNCFLPWWNESRNNVLFPVCEWN